MEYKYRAFISYRHISPDQEIAKRLHTLLETYRIPKNIRQGSSRTIGKIFRDNEELPISPNLSKNIEAALESSEWFIAVCSPQYQESKWCMKEIEYFINLRGRDRVLALIVNGDSSSCFPDILRFVPDENGVPVEKKPLAADVRGNTAFIRMRKLRKEKLRLLAPILQTGFDNLYQRQRRRTFNTLLAAASSAALLLGSFLIYALIQNARLDAAHREAAQNECDLLIEKSLLYSEENRRTEAEELARNAYTVSAAIDGYAMDRIEDALSSARYKGDFTAEAELNIPGVYGYGTCFSPDDRYIATIVSQTAIACFDAVSGERLWISQPMKHRVSSLRWSDDGQTLALTSPLGQQAALLNVKNGQMLAETTVPYASDLLCKDGRWFILHGNGILCWDPNTGEEETIVYEENGGGTIMSSVSSDKSTAAWSGAPFGSAVYVVDTEKGDVCTVELEGMKVTNGFAVSPDGRALFVFQFDHLTVVDLQSGALLWEKTLDSGVFPTGEGGTVWFGDFIITDDMVIDATNGELLYTLPSDFGAVSKDEKYLLCSDGFYRVEDGSLFCRIPGKFLAADHEGRHLLLQPDSDQVTLKACMPGEGSQYRISPYTGTIFTVASGEMPSSADGTIPTLQDDYQDTAVQSTGLISSLQISPDGRFVLLINDGTYIKVWDMKKGENISYRIYDYSTSGNVNVASVAFTSDSSLAAIAGGRGNVGVYELESGRLLYSWENFYNLSSISGIRFNPDGDKIMFSDYRQTEFLVCSVRNGLVIYDMHADGPVAEWGFDTDSGDAVIVYESGEALAAEIF